MTRGAAIASLPNGGTATYVSSNFYILLYMCPHTFLIPPYATVYVSSHHLRVAPELSAAIASQPKLGTAIYVPKKKG